MRTNESEYVCSGCFEDSGIRGFIEKHSVNADCSFCELTPDRDDVAPFQRVVEHVRTCLFCEYDDASDWMYPDSDTKEPMNEWYDAWDILERVGLRLPRDHDGRLLDALATALSDDWWSEPNPFGISRQDQVRINWDWFCEVVKHRRRYFFQDFDDGGGFEIGYPSQVLSQIFEYAQSIGLITIMREHTKLFRTRSEDPCKLLESHQELGAPPKEFATKPNRMSPPGIPMLYVSDNIETALRETARCSGFYAVGRFETSRPAKILDLSGIPAIPSVFQCLTDKPHIRSRDALIFLNHVVHEMSLPVQNDNKQCNNNCNNVCGTKDNKAHIDYVPTQVVTEFVRSTTTPDNGRIDGIKYPSAVHEGHSSYVIFDTQQESSFSAGDDLRSPSRHWIKLKDVIHQYVSRNRLHDWQNPDCLKPPYNL